MQVRLRNINTSVRHLKFDAWISIYDEVSSVLMLVLLRSNIPQTLLIISPARRTNYKSWPQRNGDQTAGRTLKAFSISGRRF